MGPIGPTNADVEGPRVARGSTGHFVLIVGEKYFPPKILMLRGKKIKKSERVSGLAGVF